MRKMSAIMSMFWTAFALTQSIPAMADEQEIKDKAKSFAESEVANWVTDVDVVTALNAANAANKNYDQAKIDELDLQWRAEVGAAAHPLIDMVLATPASSKAKSWCDGSGGLVTEVIIMDDKGLNIGICDPTSDYWQGDEAKFQKSFGAGAGAIFVDEVEQDGSSQKFQVQTSMTIVDPANGQPIGAITIGLDAEGLLAQ